MWPFDIKKKRLAREAARKAELETRLQAEALQEQLEHEAQHPEPYDARQRAIAVGHRFQRLLTKAGG